MKINQKMVSCKQSFDGNKNCKGPDVYEIPENIIRNWIDNIDRRNFELANLAGVIITVSAVIISYFILYIYSFYDSSILDIMQYMYKIYIGLMFQSILLLCISWYVNNEYKYYFKYVSVSCILSAFLYNFM